MRQKALHESRTVRTAVVTIIVAIWSVVAGVEFDESLVEQVGEHTEAILLALVSVAQIFQRAATRNGGG